jgi:hypothetical protein
VTASQLTMRAELNRELMPGHEIYGTDAEPLGECGHSDSVVFALTCDRYKTVHADVPRPR